MFSQEPDEKCQCGARANWYLEEAKLEKRLVCGQCDYSKQHAAVQRISSSQYMLDKLQRPRYDARVVDTFEKIDSGLEQLINELEFLRNAHISSHPELAKQIPPVLEASDVPMEKLQQLIVEAKQATELEILNPSLRQQLKSLIGDIGDLWKPQINSSSRTVFVNSQVDVETLSQITKSTTELVIVNCTSNDWPALFKEIASKAQITSLHLERCAVQDKDVAPAIELFGELITLNLSYNSVTNETVSLIARCQHKLQRLILVGSKLTITCLGQLATLTSLTQLDLSQINYLNSELHKLSTLSNLESLYLHNNAIKSFDVIALLAGMTRLKVLDVTGNPINEQTRLKLLQQLPSAMI